MNRVATGVLALAALALAVSVAEAKPKGAKPKPKGEPITLSDANACMGTNNSDAAQQVAACTKVLNSGKILHPYEGDYLAARGAAYNQLGQIDNALADLNAALNVRKIPEYYFQRGVIYMAKRDIAAGKADFDQVIKLKPDYAAGYQMRGLAAFQAREYQDAVKFFSAAIERVPTYYQALFARGVAKRKLGNEGDGDKDIKLARGMSQHVDEDLAPFGVTP